MASDITFAVGDGARRVTYAALAAVRGYPCCPPSVLSASTVGRGRSETMELSACLSPRKR